MCRLPFGIAIVIDTARGPQLLIKVEPPKWVSAWRLRSLTKRPEWSGGPQAGIKAANTHTHYHTHIHGTGSWLGCICVRAREVLMANQGLQVSLYPKPNRNRVPPPNYVSTIYVSVMFLPANIRVICVCFCVLFVVLNVSNIYLYIYIYDNI